MNLDEQKKFGFGCMRLPMKSNNEVDYQVFSKMIDLFINAGFTYFDTAHVYTDGLSEIALKECLVKRYPRSAYTFTDKLTVSMFNKEEDVRTVFQQQLDACGLEYFDYYLMHAQNADYYKKYTRCRAYEIAQELKAEGKIKHVGLSFHDKADVLDMILKNHPEMEVVQIQLNYIDYEDVSIESRKCYEVCCKYGIPVIVMEPVKGGSLANLPDEAKKVFDEIRGDKSYASYAMRFAASLDNVKMVLSGMSTVDQVEDNVSSMKNFKPLDSQERDAINKVCDVFKHLDIIPCTACHYCTAGCPQHIRIPDLFSCMNAKKIFKDWNSDWYYMVYTQNDAKASECIKCGKCEKACPQHLEIRNLLEQVAKTFE